jgi:hypothetical protein
MNVLDLTSRLFWINPRRFRTEAIEVLGPDGPIHALVGRDHGIIVSATVKSASWDRRRYGKVRLVQTGAIS